MRTQWQLVPLGGVGGELPAPEARHPPEEAPVHRVAQLFEQQIHALRRQRDTASRGWRARVSRAHRLDKVKLVGCHGVVKLLDAAALHGMDHGQVLLHPILLHQRAVEGMQLHRSITTYKETNIARIAVASSAPYLVGSWPMSIFTGRRYCSTRALLPLAEGWQLLNARSSISAALSCRHTVCITCITWVYAKRADESASRGG